MSGLIIENNKQECSMYNLLNLVIPSISSIHLGPLAMSVNLVMLFMLLIVIIY